MYQKLKQCKYCNISFINLSIDKVANHSRWCKLNPKRPLYIKQFNDMLEDGNRSNAYIKARKEGKPVPSSPNKGRKGLKGGRGRTPEIEQGRIKKLRIKALASKHRRLMRHTRKYICKNKSVILLDSSWEEILAKKLDSLNIDWIRPKPIKWEDSDKVTHNYFPDFYLPEYNLYVDPKNKYVQEVQKYKIDIVKKLLPNLIILSTQKECEMFGDILPVA